jgi:hypothetical protein
LWLRLRAATAGGRSAALLRRHWLLGWRRYALLVGKGVAADSVAALDLAAAARLLSLRSLRLALRLALLAADRVALEVELLNALLAAGCTTFITRGDRVALQVVFFRHRLFLVRDELAVGSHCAPLAVLAADALGTFLLPRP